jgi:hypothetical protein
MNKDEAYKVLSAALVYLLGLSGRLSGRSIGMAAIDFGEKHFPNGKCPVKTMNAASQILWQCDLIEHSNECEACK